MSGEGWNETCQRGLELNQEICCVTYLIYLLVCMYPASRLYIPLKHFVHLDTKCNFPFYPCQFHCLPYNKFLFLSTFLFRYASYRFPFYYSFLFFPFFPFVLPFVLPFPSLYSFLFPFSLPFLVFTSVLSSFPLCSCLLLFAFTCFFPYPYVLKSIFPSFKKHTATAEV